MPVSQLDQTDELLTLVQTPVLDEDLLYMASFKLESATNTFDKNTYKQLKAKIVSWKSVPSLFFSSIYLCKVNMTKILYKVMSFIYCHRARGPIQVHLDGISPNRWDHLQKAASQWLSCNLSRIVGIIPDRFTISNQPHTRSIQAFIFNIIKAFGVFRSILYQLLAVRKTGLLWHLTDERSSSTIQYSLHIYSASRSLGQSTVYSV